MKPENPTTATEQIANRLIRQGVLLEGYKTEEVRKIISFLNRDVEPDLLKQLQKCAGKPMTRKRLDTLLVGMQTIIADGYKQARANLVEAMVAQGKIEAASNVRIISGSMPFNVSMTTPNAAVIRQMIRERPISGEFVPDWFKALTLSTQQKVNRQIMIGVTEGEGIDKIIRRIVGTRANKYSDGVLERSRKDVASIVRTAVAGVSNNVRQEVYRANADIVKGVQVTATLDTRTCAICGGLDGEVFDIDKGPRPPFHYRCRCSTVPVLRSWQELGLPLQEAGPSTRASNAVTKEEAKRLRKLDPDERRKIKAKLQGQVPDSMTYPDWLRKQSVDVQNEALGKARAQMFRAGDVEIKEFVVDHRQILTLDELRDRMKKNN